MDKLKEFWQESKADYESRYNAPFLTDYDKSLPYFEKMQELLLDMQKEDKNNVDVACLLASVRMELRDSYDTCAKLLLDFLDGNENCLSESDKARIYTNIGYYIDFESSAPKHLLKAEELDSQYYETYACIILASMKEIMVRNTLKKPLNTLKKQGSSPITM